MKTFIGFFVVPVLAFSVCTMLWFSWVIEAPQRDRIKAEWGVTPTPNSVIVNHSGTETQFLKQSSATTWEPPKHGPLPQACEKALNSQLELIALDERIIEIQSQQIAVYERMMKKLDGSKFP